MANVPSGATINRRLSELVIQHARELDKKEGEEAKSKAKEIDRRREIIWAWLQEQQGTGVMPQTPPDTGAKSVLTRAHSDTGTGGAAKRRYPDTGSG